MSKIHGHTTIILKSKHGLVERVESENTFQSVTLARAIATVGDNGNDLYKDAAFRTAPWKYLVGGLLLFRDSIQVGSHFMPAGNRMTGKASVDLTNSDLPNELGSYNAVESSFSASAISQIYDFATSQGNGQISCVCLTSNEGGFVGYGNPSGEIYPNTTRERQWFGYGLNNSKYVTHYESAKGLLADKYRYTFSLVDGVLTVKEYKTNAIVGSVFAGLSHTYTFDLINDYGFPSIYGNNSGNDIVPASYSGNNKIRFCSRTPIRIASGETATYGEFDCTNHTITKKEFINPSSHSFGFPQENSNYYWQPPIFTTDNRVVVPYRTDGANATVIPMIIDLERGNLIYDGGSDFSTSHPWGAGCITLSDGLYALPRGGNPSSLMIYDSLSDTLYPTDATTMQIYSSGCGCNAYENLQAYQNGANREGENISNIIKNPLYLATINNLDTPVTKDATRTMKVIYRLEEV